MNIDIEEPENRKVRSNGQPYNYTTHNTHVRHSSSTLQMANDKKNDHDRS